MEKFNQIAEFAKELTSLQDIDTILEKVADKLKYLLNAERCSIFIADKEDKILWTKLSDGIGRIVLGLDSGIVGATYYTKEPQIVNNPYEDERFLASIDKKSGYVTKNIITVPIFNSKREIMGIIQLLNKKNSGFNKEDLDLLTFFANYISGNLELVLMSEN